MKKLPKLQTIPIEDQQWILELCEHHTYEKIISLIAMPRDQGGLGLKTNRSALSRFYRDHGPITSNSHLTSQFLELVQSPPCEIDDLVPSMTHLLGQLSFKLLVRNRPFDECRRPIEAFLRLERLSREREKLGQERESERLAEAALNAAFSPTSSSNSPNPAATPQKTKTAQPKPKAKPNAPAQSHPVPNKQTDPTPTSFNTPNPKEPARPNPPAAPPPGIVEPPQFKLPASPGLVPDFSLQKPRDLTILTKSHDPTPTPHAAAG